MRILGITRQVALVGLAAAALVTIGTSLLLSRIIIANNVQRDARVSMELVQSIAAVARPEFYLLGNATSDSRMSEFIKHIAGMPNVLRANIFSADRRIIWSSNANLIGMTFGHNPELDAALLGRLEVFSEDVRWKPEHMLLGAEKDRFIETYLPVLSAGNVIGVVEVYKSQQSLFEFINHELRAVWLCSIAGGALFYGLILLLLQLGGRRDEGLPVADSEREAVGSLVADVAKGVGARLAAIRSRAERSLESHSRAAREASEDILFDVDGIERCLLGLLAYAERPPEESGDAALEGAAISERCAEPRSREDLNGHPTGQGQCG
jgi:two-component system sensor histidine kinase HydH